MERKLERVERFKLSIGNHVEYPFTPEHELEQDGGRAKLTRGGRRNTGMEHGN